jgi:hypothetical protein
MQAPQCSAVVLFPVVSGGAVYNPWLQQSFVSRVASAIPLQIEGRSTLRGEIMASLMTEQEVSKRLNVSLASLRRWRLLRRGPAFVKVGSLVRYSPENLEAWLASLPTGGAASHKQLASAPSMRQVESSE